MPTLTMCVVGHDAATTIAAAVASLLADRELDVEVVVVDDASNDATAAAADSLGDRRVTVVRNRERLGETASWERERLRSEAPYFGVLPAAGVALPGALRILVGVLERAPDAALAHGYWFPAGGPRSREDHRRRSAELERSIGPGADLGHTLASEGNAIGPLRIYRLSALQAVGGFRGPRPDAETTLRLAARYAVVVVPRHLACADVAIPAGAPRTLGAGRRWGRRKAARRRAASLGVVDSAAMRDLLHDRVVARLAPFAVRLLPSPKPDPRRHSVGYYLWHFPVLSQTFVQRELAALARAGLSLEIFADGAEGAPFVAGAGELRDRVTYLPPRELPPRIGSRAWRFLLRRPFRSLALFLFVTAVRHSPHKHVLGDRAVFAQAATLAAILAERSIGHLHSPWADRSAFVGLVAARLVGISFSFEARAHDLHRESSHHGRRELCAGARFVVTNTEYNRRHLEPWMPTGRARNLVVMPNGLDLERFHPSPGAARSPVRLLCVGRLIEQKGILYLLEACRMLRERGLDFVCDIVGGPEEPRYRNDHLAVKKLHRRLGLEDRVRFLGALPFEAVLERYDASDLVVLPSVIAEDGSRDIIPNALLEAMAMGLPVVATTVTGIPEIVEHEAEGLLVPERDAAALADALERLIRDPELRTALGRRGRARALRDFDVTRNVALVVDLFRESLGAVRAQAGRAALDSPREESPARTNP